MAMELAIWTVSPRSWIIYHGWVSIRFGSPHSSYRRWLTLAMISQIIEQLIRLSEKCTIFRHFLKKPMTSTLKLWLTSFPATLQTNIRGFKNPDLHATTPSEITIFGATEKIIASLTIGEVCLAAVRGNLMSTLGNFTCIRSWKRSQIWLG